MAINSISISQDNVFGESNLLPVHSPLVFIADVNYTGATPNLLAVDLIEDGEVLATYNAIPFEDPTETVRSFVFAADAVIRGLLDSFDDTLQLNETLEFVEEMTKIITIKFYDPDVVETFAETEAVFIQGSAQFGEAPNFEEIYNNETDTYLAPEGGYVYVYFYNNDPSNVLTIGDAAIQRVFALDYEGSVFTDYEGTPFEINVPIT